MEIVKKFQVRGVPGNVYRANFDGRLVDFWATGNPTHILVAHDGQNIFDRKTATRLTTWQLAQNSIRVFGSHGINPPLIMGIFHSSTKQDPFGRYKDLTPQRPFMEGIKPTIKAGFEISDIRSDKYLEVINTKILPTISQYVGVVHNPQQTAMLGSSMGGLATLYGVGQRPDIYGAALAFSPHWVISSNEFINQIIDSLPEPGSHKLWMSRGTKGLDASYEPFQNHADLQAMSNGWKLGHDFLSKVYPKTSHNEKSWQSYVADSLRFWLRD